MFENYHTCTYLQNKSLSVEDTIDLTVEEEEEYDMMIENHHEKKSIDAIHISFNNCISTE